MERKQYSETEKTEIVEFKKNHTIKETKEKYNISVGTILSWTNPEYHQKQLIHQKNDYIRNGQSEERSQKRTEYNKTKYEQDPQKWQSLNKSYYENNKEKVQEKVKQYTEDHKDQLNLTAKLYKRDKFKTDFNFKLVSLLRSHINITFSYKEIDKVDSPDKLLGANIEDIKKHLELKFQPGMTWENRGKGQGKWYIGHIITIDKFDLTKIEDQYKFFNYTNLQPIWGKTSKNNKEPICQPPNTTTA